MLINERKEEGVHLVASTLDSDVSCGAFNDDGVIGELRRRGRKGREKRKASRRAITGVGRSMKNVTARDPSTGTKEGTRHFRQPRHPRQKAGIVPATKLR